MACSDTESFRSEQKRKASASECLADVLGMNIHDLPRFLKPRLRHFGRRIS